MAGQKSARILFVHSSFNERFEKIADLSGEFAKQTAYYEARYYEDILGKLSKLKIAK